MDYNPGDPFTFIVKTTGANASLAAPDAPPTAYAIRSTGLVSEVDSALVLSVSFISLGVYAVSGTIPSGYLAGDMVHIEPSATISGVTYPGITQSITVGKTKASVAGITTEAGETWEQTMKLMRAVLAGNSVPSGSAFTFYRADGVTPALTITPNATTGARSGATVGTLS